MEFTDGQIERINTVIQYREDSVEEPRKQRIRKSRSTSNIRTASELQRRGRRHNSIGEEKQPRDTNTTYTYTYTTVCWADHYAESFRERHQGVQTERTETEKHTNGGNAYMQQEHANTRESDEE